MTNTVLITGCSSGFGKATAELFAENGWNVVATMRKPEDADLPRGANVLVARLDVQDRDSIAAAIADGVKAFGSIDALVNNAGFGAFGVFEAISADRVHEQFAVNVFGVMDTIRSILPHFREQGKGTIVNLSSAGGFVAFPLVSIYNASKFAIEGLSESLYWELASRNIAVKIVEPGSVATNFAPRSGAFMQQTAPMPTYDEYVEKVKKMFGSMRGQHASTPRDVAGVIFGAVTDGKDQLRYVATPDEVQLATARRETSEDAYIQTMGKFLRV